MSGFTIFAFVLTFVYVVYFAVNITLDVYGKKDEKKAEEETFDVSGMTAEEEPIAIEEVVDNANEGNMTYTEQVTEDGLRVVSPTGNVVPSSPLVEEQEDNTENKSGVTSEELNEEIEDNAEFIDPKYQCSLLPDEFLQNLNDKHNERKIEKKNVIDNL